jgi:hypothetical protein
MMLRLQIQGFAVWLPLILLWPFVLPLMAFFGLCTGQPRRSVRTTLFFIQSWRGLEVHVDQPGNFVQIQLR